MLFCFAAIPAPPTAAHHATRVSVLKSRLLPLLPPQPCALLFLASPLVGLKRLLTLAGVPDGHAHRFRDTFSVELLLAGVPIERVSILLGHQSVRITEKHYAPWVRARQEQLEADVRRTWQTHEPKRRVHGGYTEKDTRVIPFKSRRKNGGGGGSRKDAALSPTVSC